MGDAAEIYVRSLAAAMSETDVPGATVTDAVMALLFLAAALAGDAGAQRSGFVATAGMAYDAGGERVSLALSKN